MIDEITLKKLQKIQFEILKEIKRICLKNKIEYTLCGGTLLGALRHNGFIPWDDDVDIYMTWDNFVKFEQIANQQLKKEYFFQTPKTDLECKSYFCGRVRLIGTYYESNSLPNHWKYNGIFVDVLPVIKVPLSRMKQIIYFYFFQVIIRVLWLRNGYNPHPKNLLFRLFMKISYVLFTFIPSNKLEGIISNYEKKYEKLLNYDYIDLLAANFKGSIIERSLFCNYKTHIFEDDDFSIFADSEKYLEQYYGDWTKLPPENERLPHHSVKIEFGKYY